MKQYYIYKITNKLNGMQYIGSHWGKLNDSYLGSGLAMRKAIEKYGKHNFKKEIIEIADNKDLLLEKERYWLEKFNCAINPKFYNLTNVAGGGFMSDGKTSEEKKIIREKQEVGRSLKRKQTAQKMKQTKQNWTDEQKKANSEAVKKGKLKTPQWKRKEINEKMSELQKHNWQNLTEQEKLKRIKKLKEMRNKQVITTERKTKTSDTLKDNWKKLPDDLKELKIQHMGDIVRGKMWCNNGVKNFRKTPEQIKELNLELGQITITRKVCNNGVRNFYKTSEEIKKLNLIPGKIKCYLQ
jgi:hypothetical protein